MSEANLYREEALNLRNPYTLKQLDAFLRPLGFHFEPREVDYTMALFDAQGRIAATGSCRGQVLKYVAVGLGHRATNASSMVVTHLINLLMKTHRQVFAFTRPATARVFAKLGFTEVATAEPLYSLLEFGFRSIRDYLDDLKSRKAPAAVKPAGAVVVNCNPFTLGHQYLIETAAAQCGVVYLFVVEEDRSVFPFADRWKLVEEGTRHLPNVVRFGGGPYVVSGATFPSYFLQSEAIDLVIRNQAELDVMIFARHIVPALGIDRRYVGTEPYSGTTAAYNAAMKKILPARGVQVIEIERRAEGTDAEGRPDYISATKIRRAIREDRLDSILGLLPECTRAYLQSAASAAVRARLKG